MDRAPSPEVNAPLETKAAGACRFHARDVLVTARANAIDVILGPPGGARGTKQSVKETSCDRQRLLA